MIVLLCILVLLSVTALTASVHTLLSCGHALTRQALLSEQIAELLHEVQFQARCTRKALQSELAKVGPDGYREPPKSDLEVAMDALSRGEEPVLNFGAIGRKA